MDVQHFLKPFTITSGVMHAMPTLTQKYVNISWCINIPELMKIHSFLHKWCCGIENFKYMCSGILFCFCGLISLSSCFFNMVL